MSGNKKGGESAARTNKAKYGPDFYRKIGAIGGRISRNGGFASKSVGKDGLTGRERAIVVSRRGGRKRTGRPHRTITLSQYKLNYEKERD